MSLLPSVLQTSPTLAALSRKNTKSANLDTASQEWSQRPAEERYWSLADAAQAATNNDQRLALRDVTPSAVTVEPHNGKPALVHRTSGRRATLAPLAFQQLSRFAGAPAGYLATLPADLASSCLRNGWESRAQGMETLRLQTYDAGQDNSSIRAITSPSHDLTHNSRILTRLASIVASGTGWRTPPARVPGNYTGETRVATEADCLKHAGHPSLAVTPGSMIAPSGTYLSDRDMFALLVDDSPSGQLDADGSELHRFLMVKNSETGTAALDITSGWLVSVCGNHLLWGTQDIINMRAVHRGDNASRNVSRLCHSIEARQWTDDRQSMLAQIRAAKVCRLAKDKASLIDLLFSKKILGRDEATNAVNIGYELAGVDGEPLTAWNTAQAITRMSQVSRYASDRADLDAAATKIQKLAPWN